MKSSNGYLVAAFGIAGSVLLVIAMWGVYGVLLPDTGGHAHSAGEMVMPMQFREKMMEFVEEHKLPDGSVEADSDEPVLILASQYTFTPNVLRLKTGENYQLNFLSPDVVHALSIQMGKNSFNTVIMPMTITPLNIMPMVPGTYLAICNEYCGLGHDYMYFTIIVEEGDEQADEDEHADDDEH